MSTTEILDQIDEAVTDWEARPESWLPGDPLYDRPRGAWLDEQTVRPMIQLIPDHLVSWTPRCEPCQVRWVGDGPCWICGEDRPLDALPLGPNVSWRPPAPRAVTMQIDMTPFVEALAEATARMADLFDEFGETFRRFTLNERTSEGRDGPAPLPIDGHAYRRRTRNRGKR